MDKQDRETLEQLLRDLMSAQDSVTHNSERGPDWAASTRLEIAKRDHIKRLILAFCEMRIF